jgi:hypothetical protein
MAVISLNNKTASIPLQMPSGKLKTLKFDPLGQTLITTLLDLSKKAQAYADALANLGKVADSLTPVEQVDQLTRIQKLSEEVVTEFATMMNTAFGHQWTEVLDEVGTIDNLDCIASIVAEMVSKIALAKAKEDVRK